MKALKFIFLSCMFIFAGFVAGLVVFGNEEIEVLENDILNHPYLELINQRALDETSFMLEKSKMNILIYMNATCNTRAQFLEQWHKISNNIDTNIFVILHGEMGFYMNYLIYEDRRYDDDIFILKDNSNSGYGFRLSDIGASEAVLIADDKRRIKGIFKGAGVPDTISEYLDS